MHATRSAAAGATPAAAAPNTFTLHIHTAALARALHDLHGPDVAPGGYRTRTPGGSPAPYTSTTHRSLDDALRDAQLAVRWGAPTAHVDYYVPDRPGRLTVAEYVNHNPQPRTHKGQPR